MLTRPEPPEGLTVWFAGRAIAARRGESVAGALLAAGIASTRRSAVSGAARGAYCMMGACFECWAVVDGVAAQLCLVTVRDGMRVEMQDGARELGV